MGSQELFEQACDMSKGLATFDEILALLKQHIGPVAGIETVDLKDAFGRVLAEDILAPRMVPAFDNSAIDGYAFAHASLDGNDRRLKIVAEIFAGDASAVSLKDGEAARIFTGAVMPDNADTCLMQENASLDGDVLIVPEGIKPGANRRRAGEDQKPDDVVVAAGRRLRPPELGAIASTGLGQIECRTRLKVAILSTGDEVIRPGEELQPGQIYDSNFHLLNGLAKSVGIELDDQGILADEECLIFATIERLSKSHDVILSTGGASVGDRDFIIAAMKKLGILHSWKLAIKPGRPLAVGQVGGATFLGLPGNPVAAFITWLMFVLPTLSLLEGAGWSEPLRYRLPAGFEIERKKTGRREFLRGWLEVTPAGPVVRKFGRDGSGLISGLTNASGLIELAEDVSGVEEGGLVNFIPFSEFGIRS